MFMRQFITTIFLLLAVTLMADTPKYLTIYSGGGNHSYLISNIRKITFGGQTVNNLEVHSKNTAIVASYPYSAFERAVFEVSPSGSGVESVTEDIDISIEYNTASHGIIISSQEEITSVVVYNFNGVVVDMLSPMSCEAAITLAEHLPGLYIVKAVTTSAIQTQKILKH